MSTNNKYIPELTETTSLSDVDLLYFTGQLTGDYKVTPQNFRKVINPCAVSTTKSASYIVQSADCDGRWFSNRTASGSITFTLPSIADELEVCFVVEAAYAIVITPQAGDKIVSIGIDGQSITASTLQNSIRLRATANDWYIISKSGNWSTV